MFQPFENASQFYPGLILWCDPDASHTDMLTLKQARELRPCLVVAVNYVTQSVQVARLSSKTVSCICCSLFYPELIGRAAHRYSTLGAG